MYHLCDTKEKENIYKSVIFFLIKIRAGVVVHICIPKLPKLGRKRQENPVFKARLHREYQSFKHSSTIKRHSCGHGSGEKSKPYLDDKIDLCCLGQHFLL